MNIECIAGVKRALPLASFFLLFAISPSINAQFNIGKLKKAGEDLKKVLTPAECEPLDKLKRRIQLIKDDLEKKETSMLKMHFDYGREFVGEVKSKCPSVDVKPYEDELKDLERRAAELKSGNAASASGRDDAEKQLKDAYHSVDFINDLRSPFAGLYAKKNDAEHFYESCKHADYAVRKPGIDKLADQYPDFRDQGREMYSYYNRYTVEFQQNLDRLISSFFISEINRNIEEAYRLKGEGKSSVGKALESAQAALLLCEGLLLLNPTQNKIQGLQKDAKTIVNELGGAFGAAVYTSDFHKQNAGKIVFAKSRITVGSENASAMTGAFTSNDNIYGAVYLKGTFSEVTKKDYKVSLKILVDGNEKLDRSFEIAREKREETWLNIEIAPDPATAETQGAEVYSKALSELSPRNHKIGVTLTSDYGGEQIAEGEFDLDCTPGLNRMAARVTQLKANRLAKVRLPAPSMRNAQLEKEMMAAMTWPEKPLRAVITASEWTVHRHPISGAIEFRTISAALAFKRPAGDCRIFYLSFKQDYNGRSYGKTQHYGVGDNEEIPCENVNK
jgi:hypothetical protein